MKTVKEVSNLTGVSIRALRHYDAIGLLKPGKVTEAGYRLYGEAELARLQEILLFRELQFPLKQIKQILDSPDYDPREALDRQIRLLELQSRRLERILFHARQLQKKGVTQMDFTAFGKEELDRYAQEAKLRWGGTEAYREFRQKTQEQTREQLRETGDGLMEIFSEFGAVRHLSPDSPEARALVQKLQDFITGNYYTCTPVILRSLGQMYIDGDSMTENINRAGGEGTAEFVHRAIEAYCG